MKKLLFIFFFIPLLGGVRGGSSFAQDYDKDQTIKLKSGNSEIVIDDSKIQILIDDSEKLALSGDEGEKSKRRVSFGFWGGINSTIFPASIKRSVSYYNPTSGVYEVAYFYEKGYPSIGANFGLSLNMPLSKRFSIQTDPIYSLQRVRVHDYNIIIKQRTLDIPLLGVLNFNDNISILLGPNLSIGYKFNSFGYGNGWVNSLDNYFIQLYVGGTYQLNNGLFFSFRYQSSNYRSGLKSFMNIFEYDNGGSVHTYFNSFQFIVGYYFIRDKKKKPIDHEYHYEYKEEITDLPQMPKIVVEVPDVKVDVTQPPKPTKEKPQLDFSFFTTEELKQMYKDAFEKKDYDNVELLQGELSKRAAADQTGQLRGGGDPLKGLNISKAKKIGKYFALIIGIDKYQGDWAPLNNAVRDAIAIKVLLKTKYKFDYFRTLYNTMATRENIIKELEWLVENVKEEDNVFIYYSGHGEFVKSLNKGYWVPVDAQAGSTFDYVSNSDIQTFLASINSKHTLLVSDACFSGDIFRGKTISVPFENSEKYYKKVYDLSSRQAITSGGIEPVMDGGRDGHSVFTYYLLKMLKNNDNKYYDAGQLFNDIKIPVTNNSDQSPKLQPIKNTGDEGGQFIFIKKINNQ